jgi:hypothetical protein
MGLELGNELKRRLTDTNFVRIVVVIRSSTSTTKIFLGFLRRVSEVVARGLLHQLPQEADFSLHGVVFSKDTLKSVHLIDMDGKRS